jgi:hypothetical protein
MPHYSIPRVKYKPAGHPCGENPPLTQHSTLGVPTSSTCSSSLRKNKAMKGGNGKDHLASLSPGARDEGSQACSVSAMGP